MFAVPEDALSKCQQLQKSIASFTRGDPELQRMFEEKLQAAVRV